MGGRFDQQGHQRQIIIANGQGIFFAVNRSAHRGRQQAHQIFRYRPNQLSLFQTSGITAEMDDVAKALLCDQQKFFSCKIFSPPARTIRMQTLGTGQVKARVEQRQPPRSIPHQ